MDITWVTVFVDRPADRFDEVREFWRRVTATTMSTTRGADDEFATFVPDAGDAVLKIQRVADGPGGGHLDLSNSTSNSAPNSSSGSGGGR